MLIVKYNYAVKSVILLLTHFLFSNSEYRLCFVSGDTVLILAISKGYENVAILLINNGADTNVNDQ